MTSTPGSSRAPKSAAHCGRSSRQRVLAIMLSTAAGSQVTRVVWVQGVSVTAPPGVAANMRAWAGEIEQLLPPLARGHLSDINADASGRCVRRLTRWSAPHGQRVRA